MNIESGTRPTTAEVATRLVETRGLDVLRPARRFLSKSFTNHTTASTKHAIESARHTAEAPLCTSRFAAPIVRFKTACGCPLNCFDYVAP